MSELKNKDRDRVEEILTFWFGAIEGIDDTDDAKVRLWWKGHPEDDAAIRERFSSTVADALSGKLDAWADDARGVLALVLVLDQFTRVIGRGTRQAFEGDPAAQRHCLDAIERGFDQSLRFCERSFLYMPLMHAEDKALARRSLEVFKALEEARAKHRGTEPGPTSASTQHADIVLRFGRYPHRNEMLGRASTAEEEEFLADGGPTFGQKTK